MNSARLLLFTCFAVGLLAAENRLAPNPNDPFAVYHQTVERQLSAILEREPRSRPEVPKTAPIEQNTAPTESVAADVRLFARRFWGGRQAEFTAALDRLQQLRPRLEAILDMEGVPKQLVAVVLIESGAQPLALSPRQARGLWQLIPETARRYGLTVSDEKDERVRLESATHAAARYLRDLHRHFGDWPLALAAYNAGQRAVDGALEEGVANTFWQIRSAGLVPPETRSYVPAVLAAMQLFGPTESAPPADANPPRDGWVYAPVSIN